MPKPTTQAERDQTTLVRDTRAHLGKIISELQKAYVRVDGTELDDYLQAFDKGKADVVQLVLGICANPESIDLIVTNTKERYLTV